jgi:hypothetical protein
VAVDAQPLPVDTPAGGEIVSDVDRAIDAPADVKDELTALAMAGSPALVLA